MLAVSLGRETDYNVRVQRLKALLKEQHADLSQLATEVQRKEITAERLTRLVKLVQRNVEISERIVSLMERSGFANETTKEASSGFRTSLQ